MYHFSFICILLLTLVESIEMPGAFHTEGGRARLHTRLVNIEKLVEILSLLHGTEKMVRTRIGFAIHSPGNGREMKWDIGKRMIK